MRRRWSRASALLACCAAAACAAPAPQPPVESTPSGKASPGRDLGSALLLLAEQALERGELERAERRFRRVLAADPRSPRARLGVGRVALARGDLDAARTDLEAALAAAPKSVEVRLGVAELETRVGNSSAARRHLDAALALDPQRTVTHTRIAALTGPSPRVESPSLEEAQRLVTAHPYDPWVLLRAGEALAEAGETEFAIDLLEGALWLWDLDPASANAALRRLRDLSESWRERRVVRVHAFADEWVRASETWRFDLRGLWTAVSRALSEALGIRFVMVSIAPFRSSEVPADLESIHEAMLRSAEPLPPRGIIAGFTGRPHTRGAAFWMKGIAGLLDRHLTVRFGPGTETHRVLAHEILHLFGAIHVNEKVESLMNPKGQAMTLDRLNHRIVRSTRRRRFGAGGFDRNVLPRIDLHETVEAYLAAIKVNLAFRSLGFAQVLDARRLSLAHARRRERQVRMMDPHLADMSVLVARMLMLEGRRVESLVMLEAAAELYGLDTGRGRKTFQKAERLRQIMIHELQSPRPGS